MTFELRLDGSGGAASGDFPDRGASRRVLGWEFRWYVREMARKLGLPGQKSKGGAGGGEARGNGGAGGKSVGAAVGCAGHVGSWDSTHSSFSYQWSQVWLVPDVGNSGAPSCSCPPARAPPRRSGACSHPDWDSSLSTQEGR